MDTLASELGMSKKTIYLYYKDKDMLVQGVLGIEMLQKEQNCTSNKAICKDAVHEIFLSMDVLKELFKGFNPSILHDLEKYHPKEFKTFTEHHQTYLYENLTDNLNRGIQEGNYRSSIDVDIIARFRIGSVFMLFNSNYFPHGKVPLDVLLVEITDNFLHGLVTENGKALVELYHSERKSPKINS